MTTALQKEAATALGQLAQRKGSAGSEIPIAPLGRARRHRDPREVGLNIVPLVDVTFLLMIFFVIAGSFETWEGVLHSRMPRTGARISVPLPVSPIVVHLEKAGGAGEACVIRIDRVKGQPANFEELAERLREIQRQPGFDGQTPVVLMSEDDVNWDHVVRGWNAAVRAGYSNLIFGQPKP